MTLTLEKIVGPMLSAALPELTGGAATAGGFLEREIKALAARTWDIAEGVRKQDFDLDTAKVLLAMQVNLAVAALAVTTNFAKAAIEKAIAAALKAGLGVIEAALGLVLPFAI
jgi:hypothetical protein|tara:strand:- start:1108 stop:1446 length:339 start_codon:yes stop_codon:yes gene_type:complete